MALSPQDAQAIASAAQQLQVDPRVLGGLMELESGVNPNVWGGAGGKYRGLIQFGPGARQEVGLPDREMTVAEQMPYVLKYFQQRGFKPGEHGPTELYRTVLVGNPRQSGTDSFGTNSDSAAKRMMPGGDLYQRFAAKFDKVAGNQTGGAAVPVVSETDDWMGVMAGAIMKPGAQLQARGDDSLSMPRASVIDPSDPLKTLANASLRMAGGEDARGRYQQLKADIAALAQVALPGAQGFDPADLLLPEERQSMQRGTGGDVAAEALQALVGGKPSTGSTPQPMMSSPTPLPALKGLRRATDLLTVEGGKFGAQRDGGARKHAAWDLAGEDGTVLALNPDLQKQGVISWGNTVRGDYGDNTLVHTPDGTFSLIHGEKDRERGVYAQRGWGPGGPNAYAPHFDIAMADPKTGKRTGAYFPRELLGKYFVAGRLK